MRLKKSSQLLYIMILLLVLLSNGGLYTAHVTRTISNDAEIVNKLGSIRGLVQRLVKLELNNVQNFQLMEDIDEQIDDFMLERIKLYDKANNIIDSVRTLDESWQELKQLIFAYRDEPIFQNRQVLVKASEEFWDKANYTVFVSQESSENKIRHFRVSFILFFINLVLGVVIVILIQKYVRGNLEYMVNHDTLTHIYNRKFLTDYLLDEIQRGQRSRKKLALIAIDIDYFKRVNDNFGHDVGDYVLAELADVIQKSIPRNCIFARPGGEEFAIAVPGVEIDEALTLAESVRQKVENHNFDRVGRITISLGISELDHDDDIDSLCKRADVALYKAKNSGKNRSEVEYKLPKLGSA